VTSDNEWVSSSTTYLKPREPGTGDAWAEETASRGTKGRQALTQAGAVVPPADIAAALELGAGESAIVRRRVMYADETPVELTDTYYPAWLAAGTPLAEARKIKGGAVTLLAEMGHKAARVVEDITARMPSESERAQLKLTSQEPVLVIDRLTLDDAGQPVQADVMVAPATHRRLRYEVKVN
jgi:DNA-binding GntR family transcriptional regulator